MFCGSSSSKRLPLEGKLAAERLTDEVNGNFHHARRNGSQGGDSTSLTNPTPKRLKSRWDFRSLRD